MRWALQLALLGAALVAVILNRDEWPAAVDAAGRAQPVYLLGAAVAGVAWLFVFGAVYWLVLRDAGVELPFQRALLMTWACHLANAMVKSGGMAGLAVSPSSSGRRDATAAPRRAPRSATCW
jgi:uncharacterized membrane protein YbhN (UPF0104 family)